MDSIGVKIKHPHMLLKNIHLNHLNPITTYFLFISNRCKSGFNGFNRCKNQTTTPILQKNAHLIHLKSIITYFYLF